MPRRVTVVAPLTRVDVALPLLVTVAELIPQLVRLTGLDADEAGTAGWLLTRLGSTPLDPAGSVASAGIVDGDVLYLSPRSAHLPPAVFDDVVDAVADDAGRRAGRWEPGDTIRVGMLVGLVAAVGALSAALTASSRGLAAGLLACGAVLAVLTGALLTRPGGSGRDPVGAMVAGAGVCAAAGAAALLVAGNTPLRHFGQAELLGAAAAGAFTAGLVAALLRRYTRHFATIATVCTVAVLGAAASVLSSGPPVAAVTAALALSVTAALPITALRLARLGPTPVPADMEAFRADDRAIITADITERAGLAEHMLDALVVGQVTVLGGCAALLCTAGLAGRSLAALIGLTLVVRSRVPNARIQRFALLIAGGGASVAGVIAFGRATHWQPAAAYAAGGLVVALIAFAFAVRAPRRQPSPYVSRLLDVAEFIAFAAVLPVAAAVLNLYHTMRALGG